MPNPYFQFKQFTIHHDRCAMKVTTDGSLFGAWVAKEIQELKRENQTVLDIGCGTGLLALMMAQKNNIRIDAIEIDSDAADQATENVLASRWKDNINIVAVDVLEWNVSKKYDIIVANPPFYENELQSGKKSKNIAHHDKGLKLANLFHFIKNHLTIEGRFFLLLPSKREFELAALLQEADLCLHQKITVRQSVNHPPFRLLIQGGMKNSDVLYAEIVIKNNGNEYTDEFVALLKDYYLYL